MANINDVAKLAGVSKSSVSRVINGNFEHMSDNTKNKILRAMKELEYSPNTLAQSLKKKTTKTIGIILSDISNPFWSEVLKGVQKECMRMGYGLMVSSSGEKEQIEKENILTLRNKQVDGLIINTTGKNTDLFNSLINEKYPFVFLDRSTDISNIDTVIVNNILGAKMSTQYLIDQGHRNIGILLYPLENKSPRIDRLEGYKEALKINGIQINHDLIKICEDQNGSGVEATKEMLALPTRPTAIFSTNTILNLEVIMGVKKAGLKLPEDVSLIGYDDYPWVPLLDPPLTTVSQPAFEMGVKSTALLIKKMKQKKQIKPKIIQLEPELMIRSSCLPPLK
ncbi:LacI family DNA-binding transcriptional regulator [Anaerobacillus isosaccharinicus]|uniref:LacI family DNA-binding transcriptional regulator n=1 Tax=Anaerobacillus isosaccharinicus TaxID=1532552 RepID=A0A1S2LNB0_9BACI|nr:LacI family DNA-binding transcriptional regulator [Anaerobacillus isosaccharinicus]MBA5587587.1 LacI family DNA-binding transcriptional regulator [Anaerobacillus isosaccharinicus]QOY34237.1 LacI family DNA-binding transcriptional regulator [Anaerobacillus isosaccharinicus]